MNTDELVHIYAKLPRDTPANAFGAGQKSLLEYLDRNSDTRVAPMQDFDEDFDGDAWRYANCARWARRAALCLAYNELSGINPGRKNHDLNIFRDHTGGPRMTQVEYHTSRGSGPWFVAENNQNPKYNKCGIQA